MNDGPLVITHKDCMDGFTAAWILAKALGPDALFFSGVYTNPPPMPETIAGRTVYMVDISYPRDEMRAIAEISERLIVFDHHRTAQNNLAGLEEELQAQGLDVKIVFDMERSGAGITWDEMHLGEPRPWLVNYVEDYDLWKFTLPCSKAVNAFIDTVPMEIGLWDVVAGLDLDTVVQFGRGALAYISEYSRCVHADGHRVIFQGHQAFVVNVPYKSISEVLNYVLDVEPNVEVAIGWHVKGDGRYRYSLRSREGGPKVNELAECFGGGGHVRSAGMALAAMLDFRDGGEETTDPD